MLAIIIVSILVGFVSIVSLVVSIPYVLRRNRRIFSHALLSIVRDALPLDEGLDSYRIDAPLTMKHIFRNVLKGIYRGKSLSQAMMKNRFFFGPTVIRLIQAGEESGQLLNAIEVADTIYAEGERGYFDYRSARFYLVYLIFLLLSIFTMSLFIATYIFPKWQEMFAQFGTPLPKAASYWILFTRSGLVSIFLLFILSAFIICLILVLSGARLGKVGYRIPFLGPRARDRNLSHFCRTLAVLLKHVKTLPEALKLTSDATGVYEYSYLAHQALAQIERGRTLSESLPENILVPATARWLIRSGELSGTLDQNLERAANYYHSRYIERSQTISRISLPFMVIFAGLIVGSYCFCVFSMLLQVMKVNF